VKRGIRGVRRRMLRRLAVPRRTNVADAQVQWSLHPQVWRELALGSTSESKGSCWAR